MDRTCDPCRVKAKQDGFSRGCTVKQGLKTTPERKGSPSDCTDIAHAPVTAEELRHAFDYTPETGLFRWRNPARGRARIGAVAGSLKSHGYVVLSVMGRAIHAHRAAWLYVHGEAPNKMIDHINGMKSDNRIANLRPADDAENMWNTKVAAKAKGIGKQPRGGAYYALIRHRGKRLYLGTFPTEAEASAAYSKAAKDLRGEFYA